MLVTVRPARLCILVFKLPLVMAMLKLETAWEAVVDEVNPLAVTPMGKVATCASFRLQSMQLYR